MVFATIHSIATPKKRRAHIGPPPKFQPKKSPVRSPAGGESLSPRPVARREWGNLGGGWLDSPPTMAPSLGPPARCSFSPTFLGEGCPTKTDNRREDTLVLTSLLEDLAPTGAMLVGGGSQGLKVSGVEGREDSTPTVFRRCRFLPCPPGLKHLAGVPSAAQDLCRVGPGEATWRSQYTT